MLIREKVVAKITREQECQVVQQWIKAGPELQRIRDEELANRPYDWRIVDALLDMGVRFKQPREENGLVIMQSRFIEFANKLSQSRQ